ncbi:MAG TPA: hypothetical protein DC042_16340 [Bacteroidales bacterium]|nr:hypothetical protein [Bacteroidales bacterium]
MVFPDESWLPALPWWGNDRNGKPLEIDLISESSDARTVLIGECKWTEQVNPAKILSSLQDKASRLHWLKGRNIRYALFTRNPHTGPAELNSITAEEVTRRG